MPEIQTEVLDCPLNNHWVSFRLVDEHGRGATYADLSYTLHDGAGVVHTGRLDGDGYAKIANLTAGVTLLDLSILDSGKPGSYYEDLTLRPAFSLPLTALQIAAEQSPFGPRNAAGQTYLAQERAAAEGARFYRVEVRDFVEATAHLPDQDRDWGPRPSPGLKENTARPQAPGIPLGPNQHHVLEVKALRAYSPLISRDPAFCALNAYQLAVLSACSYAPFSEPRPSGQPYQSLPPPYELPGSIGHVLRETLARGIRATQFEPDPPAPEEPRHHHLLYEEVPYSKRLEVMPHDPLRYQAEAERGWRNPEDVHFLYDEKTHTQGFITHNDKLVLISLRGTEATLKDYLLDLDARQVSYKGYEGEEDRKAQVHRGFHDAFLSARKLIDRYLEAFHRSEQSIIVCGHSLGGAIALLLGEWLRHNWSEKVQVYTFGAPRAANRAFVQRAANLVHHRLVNRDDFIPSVPAAWLDVEWKLALPAAILAITNATTTSVALLIAGLINLRGDPYEHHGEQWHFIPRQQGASLLWQPGCEVISEAECALYARELELQSDMPRRAAILTQILNLRQHSVVDGYIPAALTNLLRWNASLARRGALFTEEETTQLQQEIAELEQRMADWRPPTFQQFRRAARFRSDRRFYNKSVIELRKMYEEGETLSRTISAEQRARLRDLRRKLAQAQRPLTAQQVFGDLANREDLIALVEEWRMQADIQKAERIAAVNAPGLPLATA